MNNNAIHGKALNKAEAKIEYLNLELMKLEKTEPYLAYTAEMIAGQKAFKLRELDTWKYIKQCVSMVSLRELE